VIACGYNDVALHLTLAKVTLHLASTCALSEVLTCV
jgi:hypothetical protein